MLLLPPWNLMGCSWSGFWVCSRVLDDTARLLVGFRHCVFNTSSPFEEEDVNDSPLTSRTKFGSDAVHLVLARSLG